MITAAVFAAVICGAAMVNAVWAAVLATEKRSEGMGALAILSALAFAAFGIVVLTCLTH
jgi:hypothetical protein